MITIVIAEDHQALIDGITSFLRYEDDFKIIGTANDGQELLHLVRLKQPKVVVTDIRMPKMDGIEATKIIKKEFPHINVLALTMFDQPEAVKQMLDAGAHGYILKNSGLRILMEAIEKVAIKENYFDPNVALNFMDGYIQNKSKTKEKPILSSREKEILILIGKGKTSFQVSEQLFIAKTTVDTHRKNMIRKLNLSGSNELLKYALEKKYEF